MNSQSQPLTKAEISQMQDDPAIRQRFVTSYKLMLDFYGMQLRDETTGELGRSTGWSERYDNLCSSAHNYLRISRIFKSLAEVGQGLQAYHAAFVLFVLSEQSEHGQLDEDYLISSMDRWVRLDVPC